MLCSHNGINSDFIEIQCGQIGIFICLVYTLLLLSIVNLFVPQINKLLMIIVAGFYRFFPCDTEDM